MLKKKFALLLITLSLSLIVLAPAAQAAPAQVEFAAVQADFEVQIGKKGEPPRRPKPTPGPREGGGDD